jgi:hypothetical protein
METIPPSQSRFYDPGDFIPITRVYFNLPCKRRNEVKSFEDVETHLHKLIEGDSSPIKGFTRSNYPDAVFAGSWVAKERVVMQDGQVFEVGQKISDRHVILQIDMELDFGDTKLRETISELHQEIAETYYRNLAGQWVFWVTAHSAVRFGFSRYEEVFSELSKGFVAGKPNY